MEAVPWTVTAFKQRRRDTWKAIRIWLLLLCIGTAGFWVPFYFERTKGKVDIVHGGLAATMLDSCMGLAIHSTLKKGAGSTTLEFKISFVRPITPETGLIKAEGTVMNRGRRVGTAEGRLTDTKGRLLVHGTTTCLIFES